LCYIFGVTQPSHSLTGGGFAIYNIYNIYFKKYINIYIIIFIYKFVKSPHFTHSILTMTADRKIQNKMNRNPVNERQIVDTSLPQWRHRRTGDDLITVYGGQRRSEERQIASEESGNLQKDKRDKKSSKVTKIITKTKETKIFQKK